MNISTKEVYNQQNIPAAFHRVYLSKADSGHFSQTHWHEGIELLFVKEGTVETLIDDKVVRGDAGSIIIVNSNVLHATRTITDQSLYYCLISTDSFCRDYGFSIDNVSMQYIVRDSRLFALIDEISDEFLLEKNYYSAVVTAKLLDIFSLILREYSIPEEQSSRNLTSQMIKKALLYIESNFTKKLSIDDVANHVGYSKYHFCRCFKDVTKNTVSTYITRLRINQAISLLSTESISISETASACGFNDISYFTKTFKKYTSHLPSEYKRG